MSKIAITGKGGVGKTTLAALLAQVYAERGLRVLAIDADPAPNLAQALGFPPEALERIVPIAQMEELITERTGAAPGSSGGYFKLNPKVDDIPERYSAFHRGVRLLVMGGVKRGGAGCICPESALLRSLVRHLLLEREEVVILDMEAGTEHLGRATAQAVEAMLVVVEPSLRSIATAQTVVRLAEDIGVKRVLAVGNKVRGPREREFILQHISPLPVIGFLSQSAQAAEADQRGVPLFDLDPSLVQEARAVALALDRVAPS